MRTVSMLVQVSIRMGILRIVKVKAYKRRRNGKIEKVKSHYRRYQGIVR